MRSRLTALGTTVKTGEDSLGQNVRFGRGKVVLRQDDRHKQCLYSLLTSELERRQYVKRPGRDGIRSRSFHIAGPMLHRASRYLN